MRLKNQLFLKNFGIKQSSELQQPRLHAVKKLDLPLETVFHFMDDNLAVMGPSQMDPLFAKLQGKVFIKHETKLQSFIGNPRPTGIIAATIENDFRRNNRFFKPLRKDEAVKLNVQNVAIFNYNMLNPLFKYMDTYKAGYYRWLNNAETFWDGVAKTCEAYPTWNHYIELHVPELMPTMAQFKQLTTTTNQSLLEVFRSQSILNIFDLYRFFGDERSSSFINKVAPKHYERINFLVRIAGSFFVFNLGMLDSWRNKSEEELEIESIGAESYIDELGLEAFFTPALMQRRIVSLFTTLVEYAHGNDTLIESEADTPMGVVEEPDEEQDNLHKERLLDEEEESDSIVDKTKEEDLTDSEVDQEQTAPTNITKLFDLDLLQVTYQPPPESDLDETTLIIEKESIVDDPNVKKLNVNDGKASRPVEVFSINDPYADNIANKAFELRAVNMISERTFEMAIDDAQSYHTLPDPFGSGMTVAEAMKLEPEDFVVPREQYLDHPAIIDKSMLSSNHQARMRKFNKVLLPKFILQSIVGIQQQGVAVTDIKMVEHEDVNNHTMSFNVTVKPIRGRSSQLHFRFPVIDEDGRFKANGVIGRARQQRVDVPFRKVNPQKVALTSYVNKTFVMRSDRADNNFDVWLVRQLTARATDNTNDILTNPKYGEYKLDAFHLPRHYTAIASTFTGFDNHLNHFYFNYENRVEYFKDTFNISVEDFEKDGMVVVGAREGDPIVMSMNSMFYWRDSKTSELEPLGTIVDLIGLNLTKAPIEAINVSISNKELPLGFVLGYYHGLTTLLEKLGVQYNKFPRGTRMVVQPDEFTLAFADEILVFPRSDYKAQLVLGGLKRYHHSLRKYSRYDFDRKDVYYRIMEEASLSARYLRIIDSLFISWVDPITKEILVQMGLPTTFEGLLYKAVDALQDDWSPSEVDGAFMRYRGYERIAGTIYSSLNTAIRKFNAREGSADQQIVLDQHEVWRRITQDPTVAQVEDSNPIANIREQEAMTYRGDGGRGTVSMVARTRIFNEADIGVLSESTVDSGAVGVIAGLSPDANIDSMFGLARKYDKETDGPAKLISTSALLGVATMNDDAKRVNFISIQQQQGMYADGYDIAPLRTGYESIIAQRNTSIFATTAIMEGVVTDIGSKGITVKYTDGSIVSAPLGTIHGTAAGVNYPHILVTNLKKGDKVKPGDAISYNKRYFKEDRYVPGQVSWMNGVNAVVVFSDELDTLEDGSVVSDRLAAKLNTQITDIKNITVRFDQVVSNLVKAGDKLDLNSVLCYIEDPETAENSLFDEASLETLKLLSANTPTSKVVGVVSRVEVLYHGDLEDMSDSLRAIAIQSDKERAEQARQLGKPIFTGEVDSSFRVKGQILESDSLVIRVYIDHDVPFGTGDKGVLGNQMKTVVSRVMTGRNELEDGTPIDVIFGNTSVEERMVISPKVIAPMSMLLVVASKHVAALYRGKVNAKVK